jgi:uncharacterized protein (TIGR03437 family)
MPSARQTRDSNAGAKLKQMRRIAAFLALSGMAAVRLCAGPGVSYTGNFVADDDQREVFFTLSAPSSVALRTFSYAGGVNAAGTTIPAGGFDPTVSVFDSGGRLIAYNRDGGCGNVAADAVTSFCWDSFLQVSLPAGNYTAVLTQSENLPNGPTLADSFAYNPSLCVAALVCPTTDANGNFTAAPAGGAPGFWDFFPSQRTSFYALDIVGASASAIPTITSSAVLPSATVSLPYLFTFTATYESGAVLTWSVAAGSSLPGGLTLNAATGVLSGVPTSAGGFIFTIQVTDGVQAVTQNAVLNISAVTPPVTPVPPVVPASPVVITGNLSLGDVAVGAPIAASYKASGGAQPYTFVISGAPGLTVDSSGNVRGSVSQAGTFNPVLTATDSATNSASLHLSLAVLGVTGSFPAGTTTSRYSGSATGVGGVPPYSYLASGVPKGLNFSGSALTGQPVYPGTFMIGVQVTDSNGVTVAENFTFTITGPAPSVLTISTISLPNGFAGQPYSESLAASGGSPGYTWSRTGQQIPAGLSLNSAGTVAGTPTAAGSYTLGVQVTDTSGGQVLGTVSLNIEPAPLQITTGAIFPAGQAGVNYPSQIATATGGTPPYTFGITGSLPAGLMLSNGQIVGMPSATGTFAFTLTATDSASPPLTASLGVSGSIHPNAPDLSLSAAAASFSLSPGAIGPPTPATISVSSTDVTQTLSFSTSSSVPWLTVGGSAITPGSITVGPNTTALALTPNQSPYFGTVTVTCTSQACSGNSQTIAVSLAVAAAPPQLSLGSPILSFTALTSNLQSSSTALAIVNSGGGALAIQSVSAADSFISVGAFPATVAPGPGGSVTISVNPLGLTPGYYLSSVTVVSSAGTASVPVTLLISASALLTLGPAGTQFSLPQGGALGNAAGSFLVGVSSGGVSFNAAVLPGAPWLSGGGSGTASPASPGAVNFSLDQTAVAALAAGAYYGTIRVSGSGVANSPQDYQVVLNVSPAASQIIPNPQPAGLLFIGSGAALPPQTIQLFASSKTALEFQAAASTTDGGGWLSIGTMTGAASASSPASVKVTANPAGLAPGVYRGGVSFAFSTAVRTVNVTLIVEAPATAASTPASSGANPAPRDTTSCTGAQLVPTQTGLVSNFSSPVSWPTPLGITLVDTCGNPIGDAQVVATFSNGDPPLALGVVDTANGLYSGTWTPRNTSSQVTILARASAPGFSTASTVQIPGQVAPNTAPVLAPNGTSDIFHPQVGAGLGPGNIVQIYGSGLAAQISSPTVLPLPTQINGTLVVIGGQQAPLYYVSPGQINAQIPFELTAGNQYEVIVSANGALTTPQPIQLTDAVPAILEFASGGVVAEHQDGTLISDSSPAAPGEYVTIYLTGLGATDISVPSGTASPSNPPANVLDTPVLTVNGTQIPVLFAGLTPTLVGLYQINFQIPQTFITGEYTLLISQNGTVSNQTILSVQQ